MDVATPSADGISESRATEKNIDSEVTPLISDGSRTASTVGEPAKNAETNLGGTPVPQTGSSLASLPRSNDAEGDASGTDSPSFSVSIDDVGCAPGNPAGWCLWACFSAFFWLFHAVVVLLCGFFVAFIPMAKIQWSHMQQVVVPLLSPTNRLFRRLPSPRVHPRPFQTQRLSVCSAWSPLRVRCRILERHCGHHRAWVFHFVAVASADVLGGVDCRCSTTTPAGWCL